MPERTQHLSSRQLNERQQQYSRRLNANQNARLAKSNAAFNKAQKTRFAEMGHYSTEPPKSSGSGSVLLLESVLIAAIVTAGVLKNKNRRRFRPGVQKSPASALNPATALGGQAAIAYRAALSLLTPTETAFLPALMTVVGTQATVFLKVRLADILIAPHKDMIAFRRISQKHVDFLLCHPQTFAPQIVVELDDASHARRDRQERDRFVDAACQSAGLTILHVPVQSAYDLNQLSSLVQPHLPQTISSLERPPAR